MEAEIANLKEMLASGGSAGAELKRLLAEAEERLKEALMKIDELDKTVINNQAKFVAEEKRLKTEIDRLNNILKATNGNMQE